MLKGMGGELRCSLDSAEKKIATKKMAQGVNGRVENIRKITVLIII